MSLLRACLRASSPLSRRNVASPSLYVAIRTITSEATTTLEVKKEGDSSGIVPQPTRDVLVADVISGAPRTFGDI